MKWLLLLELMLVFVAIPMAGLWWLLGRAERAFGRWLARRMGIGQ